MYILLLKFSKFHSHQVLPIDCRWRESPVSVSVRTEPLVIEQIFKKRMSLSFDKMIIYNVLIHRKMNNLQIFQCTQFHRQIRQSIIAVKNINTKHRISQSPYLRSRKRNSLSCPTCALSCKRPFADISKCSKHSDNLVNLYRSNQMIFLSHHLTISKI